MCNPDCILNRTVDQALLERIDALTETPEFVADRDGGFDFCHALSRALQRPEDDAA